MPELARASVRVIRGGPMLIEGALLGRLVHDGDRWRTDPVAAGDTYAICRCGRSGSMPFCDRDAPYGCFDELEREGPEPGPFRWDVPDPEGPPAVALKPDGPVRVAGDVTIRYDDAPQGGRDRWSLCRCGASRCQPVCDSSHKVVGYRG
ncbi:MAG TPA: CDGSH iron-sulfur domain-containing protein [Actinomycetota bacterium]|nr:CDGSH iron-sulfur domain-containing protein [Actinomycetota bacterium]